MVRVTGIEGFQRNLQKKVTEIKAKAEAASGAVSLPDLMPKTFVDQYTEFQTLQDMVDAAGIEDPEELKGEVWNTFVAEHSQFSGWEEMIKTAGIQYMKRKLSE